MSDLIRRQDVLRICDKYNGQGWVWSMIRKEVEELPSVEPKTGHWIAGKYKDTCSHCRCTYPKNIGFKNYCPNCGYRMVEPQERSDKEC